MQGVVPHFRSVHYRGSHYCGFWLIYTQVGDFPVSRGPPSVPLTQIFFKAQNLCKAGIICITKNVPNFLWFVDDFEDGML